LLSQLKRGLLLGFLFVRFFLRGLFFKVRYFRDSHQLNKKLRESVTQSAGEFCEIFGIEIDSKGFDRLRKKNRIVTSNHLSYVDIIVFLSQEPFAFLTSKEVYQHWFTGPFIRFSGSSYVDRKSPSQLRKEYDRLQRLLNETPIVLFPEATSSDGQSVLPFKRALLEWARTQGISVQTSCLRYLQWNENEIESQQKNWSDYVHYYGEMNFFKHLWNFLKTSKLKVKLRAREESFDPRQFVEREEWLHCLWSWTSKEYSSLLNPAPDSARVEIKNINEKTQYQDSF